MIFSRHLFFDYINWLVSHRFKKPKVNISDHGLHDIKVKTLQVELLSKNPPYGTHRGGRQVHHVRGKKITNLTLLDLSSFNEIFEINTDAGFVWVEALVTIKELVEISFQHQLRPLVVPETPSITVGGALQGLAAESSCFKQGLFHESTNILEIEVLLGNGDLKRIKTNDPNYKDFLSVLYGSYGTLAIITAVKVKLIPTKPYVLLTYKKLTLKEFSNKTYSHNNDFLDAIIMPDNQVVEISGIIKDKPEEASFYKERFYSKWFSKHITDQKDGAQEYMELKDYFFRWDRSGFFYASSKLGDEFLSRFIFGKYASMDTFYRIGGYQIFGLDITQDYMLPKISAEAFFEELKPHISKTEPLWLLPISNKESLLFGPKKGDWLDFGIYQRIEKENPEEYKKINKNIEALVKKFGGFKTLYADHFYSYEDFWSIYDKKIYNQVRRKYQADKSFPDIYEKIT